jgi:3-hydroxyacyl-CoA dehydrogenase
MAMGPFAVMDLAGLDIGWRMRKAFAHRLDPAKRSTKLADTLVELGRLGQKSGAGYYRYEAGSRVPHPDPLVEELIARTAAEAGIVRRSIGNDEIIERCLYSLVNEGARILDEGIALRASDIDLVWTNGYGFPAWRGGPMHWADSVGLKTVLRAIEHYGRSHDYFEPAALLQKLVADARTFADIDAKENADA